MEISSLSLSLFLSIDSNFAATRFAGKNRLLQLAPPKERDSPSLYSREHVLLVFSRKLAAYGTVLI